MIKIFKNIFATEVPEATEALETQKEHGIFAAGGIPRPHKCLSFWFSAFIPLCSLYY